MIRFALPENTEALPAWAEATGLCEAEGVELWVSCPNNPMLERKTGTTFEQFIAVQPAVSCLNYISR